MALIITRKKSNFTSKRIFPCIEEKEKRKKPQFSPQFFPPPCNLLHRHQRFSSTGKRGSGSVATVHQCAGHLTHGKEERKGRKGQVWDKKGDEIGCKYAGTRGWAWTRGAAPCVVGTCRVGHGCHSRTNIRGIYPWSASAYPEYHIQYQPSYPCEASPFPRPRE